MSFFFYSTLLYCSVFFCEDIASERGAGSEILQGTALRMPKSPDYESFKRIIDKVECSECLGAVSSRSMSLCLYFILFFSSHSLFPTAFATLFLLFSHFISPLQSLYFSSSFALLILPSLLFSPSHFPFPLSLLISSSPTHYPSFPLLSYLIRMHHMCSLSLTILSDHFREWRQPVSSDSFELYPHLMPKQANSIERNGDHR